MTRRIASLPWWWNCPGLPSIVDQPPSPASTSSSSPSRGCLELLDVRFLSGEVVPVELQDSDFVIADLQRRIGVLLTIPSDRVVMMLCGEVLEEHCSLHSLKSTITVVVLPSDEDQVSMLIQELIQKATDLLATCDFPGAQHHLDMAEQVYADDFIKRLVALLSQVLKFEQAFRTALLGDASPIIKGTKTDQSSGAFCDVYAWAQDLLTDVCELETVPTALTDPVQHVVADAKAYIEVLGNIVAVHNAVRFSKAARFLAPSAVIRRLRIVQQEASAKAGRCTSFVASLTRLAIEAELLSSLLTADFKTSLLKGADAFVQVAQAERVLARLASTPHNIASSEIIRWYTRFYSHCFGRLLLLFGAGLVAATTSGPNQMADVRAGTSPPMKAVPGQSCRGGITGALEFNVPPTPYSQDLKKLAAIPGVACVGIFVNAGQVPHLAKAKQSPHNWREPFQDGAWFLPPPEAVEHTTTAPLADGDFEWWVLAFAAGGRTRPIQEPVSDLDLSNVLNGFRALESWQHEEPIRSLRSTLSRACADRHKPLFWSSQTTLTTPTSPGASLSLSADDSLGLHTTTASPRSLLFQHGTQRGAVCNVLGTDVDVRGEVSECLLGLTVEMPSCPYISSFSPKGDSPAYRCLAMPLDIGTFRSPLFLGLVEYLAPVSAGASVPSSNGHAGSLKSEDGLSRIERELVALAVAISGRRLRITGEAKSEMPSMSPLSNYLLAYGQTPYLSLPAGYESGHGCLGDNSTGVIVRCPPIQVTPISKKDIVLYHYTDLGGFAAITGQKYIKHLRASYAERAHFGDGIYASQYPPDYFGSKERILLNNYTNSSSRDRQQSQIQKWRDKGVVDYCVPMVVSRDSAVNVSIEKTREMAHPGHTLLHGPMREDRDIWVVVVSVNGKVTHGYEDVESVYPRLTSSDFSMRQDAVEILARHTALGDIRATQAVCQSLYDDDFNVRIAAVWALLGARSLTKLKKEREITKLAQNESVDAVLDAAKEALVFLHST